jgi:inosose dehydratase
VRAGINIWTWGTNSKEQFEQGVKEVADIGYRAIENLIGIGDLYKDSPDDFDALMARYSVEFVCGYFHLTGDFESDLVRAKRGVRFLQRHGAHIMNIQAGPRPEEGPSREDLETTVEQVRVLCGLAHEHGVTPCLHPHYNTIVERADELAFVTDRLNPSALSLALDTAHTVLGGMDPVATFVQYATRVAYVHMKDITSQQNPGEQWFRAFRELGRGMVDFAGAVKALADVGFDGVLCVELDRPRVCGYKSAAISRQYLRDELGL